MKALNTLPVNLQKHIGDRPYTLNEVGMSDSQVICFEDMVLKVERQREESDNEYRMMRWLQEKLPVPKVLAFEQQNGYNYLLMSRVEGEMSCNEQLMQDPQGLVQLLAEGLKQLWQVDITDCPYQNATENKLRLARERVETGRCSTDNVEPDTYGENGFASPAELLQWLEDHQPEEDLVFAHGDYCLPNIFIQDGQVSGFIDLGRSGVADRYQDIALCYRSLKHNYAGEYGGKVYPDFRPKSLFEALGIEPDWNKIRYYNLLDELF